MCALNCAKDKGIQLYCMCIPEQSAVDIDEGESQWIAKFSATLITDKVCKRSSQ